MNDIEQDLQQNRRLLYALAVVLVLMSGLIYKFYKDQKRENSALKIKILSLNKTRNITPWERLISKPQISLTPPPNTIIQDKVTTKAAATLSTSAPQILTIQNNQPIQNLTTQELANILNLRMLEVKSLDLAGLEKNIELAEEIISREPDSYSAYKAKLISMLIEEGKFDQAIDDSEVNRILETMASFDLSTDSVTRREAALISNTNNEIFTLSNNLNQISEERQGVEIEMEFHDPNSPELRALEIERHNLLTKEEEMANIITELNIKLNSGFTEEKYLNEDVIQIPFWRMMAKENYEGVIDDAVTLLEQFPDSPDGYFFLVMGYEATGKAEDARRVIEESKLTDEGQKILQQRLQNFSAIDPKKYWEKLNF